MLHDLQHLNKVYICGNLLWRSKKRGQCSESSSHPPCCCCRASVCFARLRHALSSRPFIFCSFHLQTNVQHFVIFCVLAAKEYPGYDMALVGSRIYGNADAKGCVEVETLIPVEATVCTSCILSYSICFIRWLDLNITQFSSIFKVVRLDATDYNITDAGCINAYGYADKFPCSITKSKSATLVFINLMLWCSLHSHYVLPVDEGAYQVTATICDVKKHTWMGWRMDQLMQNAGLAYFTVYFSQEDQWLNINKSMHTLFVIKKCIWRIG